MMTEDLTEFLDTDDFAVTGTVGASSVDGIFDAPHAESLGYVSGNQPTFLCRAADLPTITKGTTTASINGTSYVVVDVQPDGHGLTTLVLERS